MIMRIVFGLIAAVLTACAGPRPAAPAAATVVPPTNWRDGTAIGAANAISADWWQNFGDPVLTRIVEKALRNNVDIAMAATRVEEARAQFALARGQQLPTVELGAGGKRERYLNDLGFALSDTANEAQVGIAYDLDLFGRMRRLSESARASLLATEAAGENVRLAVASSAASGYIGLRTLDDRLAVVHQTVDARAESLRVAQRQAKSGYATKLVLEQAEAELYGTQQLVPSLELAITEQENGLSILLGENPRSIERGRTVMAIVSPVVPNMLPSELLRRRPDIAQAEEQIVAADRSLDAARAEFMPDVRLGISGGYVDSTLIPDPVGVFSIGGSILAPLYEGGRLRAQANLAAARRDEAAYAYRKLALDAFREVEDALAAVQRTAEQERVLEEQRDALAEALTQATKRYRAGYSSYLEQLDAQRGLLSADLSVVQANGDRLSATVRLFRALGGGWAVVVPAPRPADPGDDRPR